MMPKYSANSKDSAILFALAVVFAFCVEKAASYGSSVSDGRTIVPIPIGLIVLIIVCCCCYFQKKKESNDRAPMKNHTITVTATKPSRDSKVGIRFEDSRINNVPCVVVDKVRSFGLFNGSGLVEGMEVVSINDAFHPKNAKEAATLLQEADDFVSIEARLNSYKPFWVKAIKPSKAYPVGLRLNTVSNQIVVSELERGSLFNGTGIQIGMPIDAIWIKNGEKSLFRPKTAAKGEELLWGASGEIGLLVAGHQVYCPPGKQPKQDVAMAHSVQLPTTSYEKEENMSIRNLKYENQEDLNGSNGTAKLSLLEPADSDSNHSFVADEVMEMVEEGRSDQNILTSTSVEKKTKKKKKQPSKIKNGEEMKLADIGGATEAAKKKKKKKKKSGTDSCVMKNSKKAVKNKSTSEPLKENGFKDVEAPSAQGFEDARPNM